MPFIYENYIKLSFNDFTSEEKYLKLQNNFAGYCAKEMGSPEDKYSKINYLDFSILLQINDGNLDNNYKDLSFYEDFLFPKIEGLAENMIEKLDAIIYDKYIYDDIKRPKFIESKIGELLEKKAEISIAKYLNPQIILKLDCQLDIIYEFLINYDSKTIQNNNHKLKFKIPKTDLLVFLHLLRERGLLSQPFDSNLGYFLDANFQYYDVKNKTYIDMKKSAKTIGEIKNKSITFNKSITRLKNLLKDDSFYEF